MSLPSHVSRRRFLKLGGSLVVFSAAVPLLAACSEGTSSSTTSVGLADASTLDRIREQGFVRVAFANEPPFAQVSSDGVSVTGAAPDVARAVMGELGVPEVSGVVTDWGAMIPGLQAERFDLVTAGLFITPERCEEVSFSEPDVCSVEVLVVEIGNPLGLTSIADLGTADGLTMAVIPGNIEEQLALDAGVDPSNFLTVADARGLMEALTSGRANAILLPDLTAKDMVPTTEGAESTVEIVEGLADSPIQCSGAVFRKGDEDFLAEYNSALETIKESGEFQTILESYGFPADVAMATSTADLCAG